MRLRRPLPAVQGDTLHIVGVGDNRIGKQHCCSIHYHRCLVLEGVRRAALRNIGSSDKTKSNSLIDPGAARLYSRKYDTPVEVILEDLNGICRDMFGIFMNSPCLSGCNPHPLYVECAVKRHASGTLDVVGVGDNRIGKEQPLGGILVSSMRGITGIQKIG